MQRVNRVTQESVEEAKFEAKYGVEVVRNKETGAIKIKKRPRNEIDERIKQNMENHKRVKKGQKPVQAVVLAPEEKRKLVKAMLAEKKEKKLKENAPKIEEFKRDEFKFGEVVHAPPQLVTPRLAQKAETVPRVRFINLIDGFLANIRFLTDFFTHLIYSPAENLCCCTQSLSKILLISRQTTRMHQM